MARRRRDEEETEISKAWLDSYADAITLLMAFFVMLFAFSLIDKKKFDDFKFGVEQAFGKPNPTIDGGLGLLDRGTGIAEGIRFPPIDKRNSDGAEGEFQGKGELTTADFDDLASALSEKIDAQGLGNKVEIDKDPRGLVLHLDDSVLFDSGEAFISLIGANLLTEIAGVLARIDNLIVIEGHTDNVPTRGSRWATNWELSVARATHVLRWMIENRELAPSRVSAAGYADTRPRDTNTTAEGRSRNRRVEIVVVLPRGPDGEVIPAAGLSGTADEPASEASSGGSAEEPAPAGSSGTADEPASEASSGGVDPGVDPGVRPELRPDSA